MITITIPMKDAWSGVNIWAMKNCPSYVKCDIHQDGYNTYDPARMDYFFTDERDATWFRLRWN